MVPELASRSGTARLCAAHAMPAPEPFDLRLVASRPLAPSVRALRFDRVDGRPIAFDPGQWLNLVLPLPAGELRRAYSIASAPDGTSTIEIAVTLVAGGAGSAHLHALREGEVLRAIGPQGFFTRAADDVAPALLVGTGTGITPLRSMLAAATGAASTSPIWVLFGARREADVIYRGELEALARERPNVRYEITLSQPSAAWAGRRGYVQAHVPELVAGLRAAGAPAEPHVYVCGLERMVKAVRATCRGDLGLDRRNVHAERYD